MNKDLRFSLGFSPWPFTFSCCLSFVQSLSLKSWFLTQYCFQFTHFSASCSLSFSVFMSYFFLTPCLSVSVIQPQFIVPTSVKLQNEGKQNKKHHKSIKKWSIWLLCYITSLLKPNNIFIWTDCTVVNTWSGSTKFIKVALRQERILVLGQLWWKVLIHFKCWLV